MKNIKRYIPEDLDALLKSKKHFHTKWNKDLSSEVYELDYEGLVIACDTILRIAGKRELDSNNFVEIQSKEFHKILHHDYKLYVDYLVENKIVVTDGHYVAGEKSIGYKINDDFLNDSLLKSIIINDKLFNKRTINAIAKLDTKMKVTNSHKSNYLKSFKIDYNSAIQHLIYCYTNQIEDKKKRVLNSYTKAILQHKLLQIKDGDLWIMRSNTNGRINSNLTTLNGDYKQFILGYDYSLDIKSSQPLLINVLINQIQAIKGQIKSLNKYLLLLPSYECKTLTASLGKVDAKRVLEGLKTINLPNKDEILRWKSLCERGELYNFFIELLKTKTHKKYEKPEVKEIIFATMFSNSRLDTEYKILFNGVFPSIYKFMGDVKKLLKIKRAHKVLPLLLQSIESFIWCENILPELDKMKIPYLFVHDSVIVKTDDLERTELKIKEIYYLFGVDAAVDKETLI